MTDLEFQDWLENPSSIKKVLVIAKYYDVTSAQEKEEYLSNTTFITTSSTSVTVFNPIIVGGISVSEQMGINKGDTSSISYGDIELENINGDIDTWIDTSYRIWTNRSISIYLGDPSWSATTISDITSGNTFRLVFKGIISSVSSRSTSRVNIVIRDRLEELNTSASTKYLNEVYSLSELSLDLASKPSPIILGEVFNIQPILVDDYFAVDATYSYKEYLLHYGTESYESIEDIIEIRDNGIILHSPYNLNNPYLPHTTAITLPTYIPKVDGTPTVVSSIDKNTGTFRLSNNAVGTLTVSAQGDKRSVDYISGNTINSYKNTVPNYIALLVKEYGKKSFTAADIDLTNFSDIETLIPYSIGYYTTSRDNILSICQSLVASIGCQLSISALGKLRILSIDTPSTSNRLVTNITEDDMLYDSFNISEQTEVSGTTSINYCKNYNVQNSLNTLIPDSHKKFYTDEYRLVSVSDSVICNKYGVPTQVEPINTYLISTADAAALATKLNNYYKVKRTVYSFSGTPKLLSLYLGQKINIRHHRYGLSSGVDGIVVSLSKDWISSSVEVGVLI